MIICDTHVVIRDALGRKPLGATVRRALDRGEADGTLACADISLWEIACLIAKRRLRIDAEPATAIGLMLAARNIRVLPLNPDIVVTACGLLAGKADPADRFIAATAIVHQAALITVDARLHGIPCLKIIW